MVKSMDSRAILSESRFRFHLSYETSDKLLNLSMPWFAYNVNKNNYFTGWSGRSLRIMPGIRKVSFHM